MPVIPVNKVMDNKRIIEKREGQGGSEAQEIYDEKIKNIFIIWVNVYARSRKWLFNSNAIYT
jgi:protein subunit release factor A